MTGTQELVAQSMIQQDTRSDRRTPTDGGVHL